MNGLITAEGLLIVVPLILFELAFKGFCFVKIFKEGVGNLNKWGWFAIVLLGMTVGPILFLTLGRRRDI